MFGRGKIIRQAQNARAYAKRHGRRGPHTTTPRALHNPLPSSISQFANPPLPKSFLFHQSLHGSDLIDVSDLSQWDKAPPYNSLPPPDSPEEQRFTRNLFDVMHGHNLRVDRESRAHRQAVYDAGGASEVLEELRDAQKRLLAGWDDLNARIANNLQVCGRHKLMAECYRHGVARRILTYQREVDLLVTGQNPYCLSP
jgi:hypothetical protein